MEGKILLGKIRRNIDVKYVGVKYIEGELIFLSKHQWSCDWYWGFGYIGNKKTHTHFDSVFLEDGVLVASEIFENTKIQDSEWWILRDLFIQAYALKKCAEIYILGGHQTSKKGITDIIKNDLKAKVLNEDLEIILDKIWSILIEINKI